MHGSWDFLRREAIRADIVRTVEAWEGPIDTEEYPALVMALHDAVKRLKEV